MFKILISKLLLAFLIVGLILLAYSVSLMYGQNVAFHTMAIPTVAESTKTTVAPVLLQIPSLHIDAPIESVGVTRAGAMDVPQNIESVAWFGLGVVPGDVGSAVIGGHFGWKDQQSSAFDHLAQIREGSLINITSASGTVITFKVRQIKTYAWNADAKEIFISTDGKSHVNLITCAGKWEAKNKTYLERIVVFADKVE